MINPNLQISKMIFISLIFLLSCESSSNVKNSNASEQIVGQDIVKKEYAIVIHGGAGTILKENMSTEQEKAYLDMLHKALDVGSGILKDGGSSIDAVQKTINLMEDSPLFNAGKGAVFTNSGTNELDASIMFGKDQNAGAVGGVSNIKNPINAARAVMEQSEHVMMVGKGAETFAERQGIEIVNPSYFHTDRRKKALDKIKENEKSIGSAPIDSDYKFGTVGCVALDKFGNITAGTSTGGMTNKRYNRIGDSPIIGAGTYADNNSCGISSTGHGEYFIRYAVAHDIAARMEYKGIGIVQAAEEVVLDKLVKKGGSGGIVGLDRYGNIAMVFNSAGMYRGFEYPGKREVKIYKD